MIIQILSRTPSWVFALFFGLLALGLLQTRTRRVRKIPALLLPVGMMALSLAGINSSFGLRPVPLASWAVALALAAFVGFSKFRDERVEYDATTTQFLIPGSWVPLVVIMAIFFTKYAYAVTNAINPKVVSDPLFVAALSGVYGLLSGYFTARGLNLIMKARVQRLRLAAATRE